MKQKLFNISLLFIFLLAAFLRLYQLGSVPVSFSDDETRLVYSAYSIWQTGRDLNRKFLPLAFQVSGFTFNPLPIYLTSPFVGILGLSMFAGRLPFALAGIATVVLVYFLARKLSGSRLAALSAAFMLAISPWHLQLSRFAYEGTLALFFYTFAVWLFLHADKHHYKLFFLALISFFCGFYSYSGYKLTFMPIIIVLTLYLRKTLSPKQIFIVVAFIPLTFATFWYLGKTQSALTYGSQLFFYGDNAKLSQGVELERRSLHAPDFLERLYHNKLTVLGQGFINQYVTAVSPEYLFTAQEGNGIFSLWSRGQLYYHEAVLLIGGILFLFICRRRQWLLIISLLLLAPIPAGLGASPVTYTIRASFMLPWLAIAVGSGVKAAVSLRSNFWLKLFVIFVIAGLYLYYFGGYLTQYYYDWYRYGAKYYSQSDKNLSQYLNTQKSNYSGISVHGVFEATILNFAFYSAIDPDKIQGIYNKEGFDSANIHFTGKCIDLDRQIVSTIDRSRLLILTRDCYKANSNTIWLKTHPADDILYTLDQSEDWYAFKI